MHTCQQKLKDNGENPNVLAQIICVDRFYSMEMICIYYEYYYFQSVTPMKPKNKNKFPKNVMFSKEQLRQGHRLGRLHNRSFSYQVGECITEAYERQFPKARNAA